MIYGTFVRFIHEAFKGIRSSCIQKCMIFDNGERDSLPVFHPAANGLGAKISYYMDYAKLLLSTGLSENESLRVCLGSS